MMAYGLGPVSLPAGVPRLTGGRHASSSVPIDSHQYLCQNTERLDAGLPDRQAAWPAPCTWRASSLTSSTPCGSSHTPVTAAASASRSARSTAPSSRPHPRAAAKPHRLTRSRPVVPSAAPVSMPVAYRPSKRRKPPLTSRAAALPARDDGNKARDKPVPDATSCRLADSRVTLLFARWRYSAAKTISTTSR